MNSTGLLKRLAMKALSVGFVGSLATAAACSHNDGSIFIAGVMSPPTGSTTGVCLYQANAAGPFQSSGFMDVALSDRYVVEALIANQLVPRGDNSNLRVETNRFVIQGAIVRLTDSVGATIKSFTVQGGGEVDPASGGTPGYQIFATPIVDSATAASLRDITFGNKRGPSKRLIAYFKVFGATTGGQSIESMEFLYPIEACWGCLVTFPAAANDPAFPGPNCKAAASSSSQITVPCYTGADQAVDCRLCSGNPACVAP